MVRGTFQCRTAPSQMLTDPHRVMATDVPEEMPWLPPEASTQERVQ